MNRDELYYRQAIKSSLVREFLGGIKAADSHIVQEAWEYFVEQGLDPVKIFKEEASKLHGNSSC